MTSEREEDTPLFIEIDEDGFSKYIQQNFEKNILALPPLYNPGHKKFLGLSHLFSVYQESYFCILCGLYHPGIMLMGQLFEIILKEIILIHDNVNNERALEGLIRYAINDENKPDKKNQRQIKGPLLPMEIINLFIHIKDNIRNPYMHLNYGSIFKDEKIRAFRFASGANFEELLKNTEIIAEKLRKGQITPEEIDPIIDKIIADSTKRENDVRWAIEWAWELFPLFELLIDEYLTSADYEKHSLVHKNDYDTIPFIDLE